MYALIGIIGFVGFLVSLVLIIIKAIKKQPKKKYVIALAVCFVLFVIALIITPSSDPDTSTATTNVTSAPVVTSEPVVTAGPVVTTEPATTSAPVVTTEPTAEVSEIDALRQELKTKYDVGTPQKFVRGDATGAWRIVTVVNATPPSYYAVEYARAYMEGGGIHYIVNFSLKTTTMIRISLGIVEAKTTEYVNKEEHDASIIGQGMLYTDSFFYLETGEEIKAEADPNAGTVDASELIRAVREAIDGAVGEGEKIADVQFDGKNLTVVVDLTNAKTNLVGITPRDIALSRLSSITDDILDLDDKYFNTWDTITLDFGSAGKAMFDKSLVVDQGFGKFFNFSGDILK